MAQLASSIPVRVESPAIPAVSELDLTGKWEIESELTNSTYSPFHGLKLYYHVGVIQMGNEILVNGEKDSEKKENGLRIVYERQARTRFTGEGSLESRNGLQTLKLKVKEGSTSRGEISSRCNLDVIDQNLMKGAFSSQAASSIGKCTWRRVSSPTASSN